MGLNERQVKAVLYVVENGSITNSQYQQLNAVGKTVATEELQELIGKTVLKQTGSKGRGVSTNWKSNWPRIGRIGRRIGFNGLTIGLYIDS